MGGCLSRSFLFVANVVDLLAGTTMLGGSVYYSSKVSADVSWMFDTLAGVGGCLMIVALFSWFGTSNPSRSVFLLLSSWLALPLCLLCFVMAIVTLAKWGDVEDKLKEDQASLDLSDSFISSAETWHTFAAYIMFGLSLLEFMRFHLSKSVRQSSVKELKRSSQKAQEAEDAERQEDLQKKLLIQDKYDGMRQGFREKYGERYDKANGREPYADL